MAALNRRRLQVILNQVPNTLHFLGVEAVILSQSQKQLPSEKLAFIGEKYCRPAGL